MDGLTAGCLGATETVPRRVMRECLGAVSVVTVVLVRRCRRDGECYEREEQAALAIERDHSRNHDSMEFERSGGCSTCQESRQGWLE